MDLGNAALNEKLQLTAQALVEDYKKTMKSVEKDGKVPESAPLEFILSKLSILFVNIDLMQRGMESLLRQSIPQASPQKEVKKEVAPTEKEFSKAYAENMPAVKKANKKAREASKAMSEAFMAQVRSEKGPETSRLKGRSSSKNRPPIAKKSRVFGQTPSRSPRHK